EGNYEKLPGFFSAHEECIVSHTPTFIDLRLREFPPSDKQMLFITPVWNPDGFVHRPLPDFIARLNSFFTNPEEYLLNDLSYCHDGWRANPNPWWLSRICELQIELGLIEEAMQTVLYARHLFPDHSGFSNWLTSIDLTPRH